MGLATRLALLVALLLALPLSQSNAQTTVSEAEFWKRMADTLALLESGGRENVTALWADVMTVRLQDETLLMVDMGWLRNINSAADTRNAESRVRALLTYHGRGGTLAQASGLLAGELERLQSDPRFQYNEEPRIEPVEGTRIPTVLSPALAQVVFFAIVVTVAVTVAYLVGRSLLFPNAALPQAPPEADPVTARQAQERALVSESQGDRRAAVRYLYLASLLLLDERGALHYNPTLTNREHLRQVQNNIALHDALRPVVQTFDHVWYGFAPLSDRMYAQFKADVARLEALAEQERAA